MRLTHHRLWEGSWADDALQENAETGVYADPSRIKYIHHDGEHFKFDGPHILDPSPQRTPFLFQAGTSPAGVAFGAKHAEGIFVSAPSPHILAPRIQAIREEAARGGRDPRSVKVFAILTPIVGRTDEEAQEKYREALENASEEAGLAFFSGGSGIDLSKFDLDTPITPSDVHVDARIHSTINTLSYQSADVPPWTPRNIGKRISIGGAGPVPVGSASTVADFLEEWVRVADLDGFNIGYVQTPGTFEDVVELLVPELRRRGVYAPENESGTMRERMYGPGQKRLREDHVGRNYAYEVYDGQ
jgi:FMN-dependent oxidoreductase (nitrilotriacetate monooxygenase family)